MSAEGGPFSHLDAATLASVDRAAALLRAGGLVALPTETVYGLGANALAPEAVLRIFEAKQRPSFDPLIVHVPCFSDVERVAHIEHNEVAKRLAEAFWPGPLTLVLPKRSCVPDLVTSGLDTVAVRVPAHPVMRAVLSRAACPIAAPSANPFGYVSPTTAAHVAQQLGDKVDMILDAGACRIGLESTIVAFEEEGPVVLRYGGLSLEALRTVVPEIREGVRVLERPLAPGQLARHYAPRTRLRLLNSLGEDRPSSPVLLVVAGQVETDAYQEVLALAPNEDLSVAAANLFAMLRRLDESGYDSVDVLACEERGLGKAIMDRLRRATVRD